MKLEKFVTNFADQFDDTDPNDIIPSTVFKEMGEWSSLIALSVIAMVDEEYDIHIGAKEIMKARTIEDLYNIIINK